MLKKNSQNWIKFGMVDEKIHKHETTWDVQWSFIAFGCVCSFFSSFVCLFITYALQTGKHRFLVLNRRSVPCKCVRSSTVSCCYARLKGQMLISTECIRFHYRLRCFDATDTQIQRGTRDRTWSKRWWSREIRRREKENDCASVKRITEYHWCTLARLNNCVRHTAANLSRFVHFNFHWDVFFGVVVTTAVAAGAVQWYRELEQHKTDCIFIQPDNRHALKHNSNDRESEPKWCTSRRITKNEENNMASVVIHAPRLITLFNTLIGRAFEVYARFGEHRSHF